jgi:hypothetical protein
MVSVTYSTLGPPCQQAFEIGLAEVQRKLAQVVVAVDEDESREAGDRDDRL